MKIALAASGLDVPWLAELNTRDYHSVIERQMQRAGGAVAKRSGLDCRYAEGFRRVRFNGIESLAEGQTIAEDV
jgi:hypothetical protein